MRFGTAIERLVDNYQYAKSKIWIRDEVAWALYHTWKEADDRKTEPTISKMEQVDKDINVRSKDEPQTDEHCETCRHKDECEGATYEYKNTEWWCLAYAPIDEPQTDCPWR